MSTKHTKRTEPSKTWDASPAAQEKRRLILADLVFKEISPHIRQHGEKASFDPTVVIAEDTRMMLWLVRSMLVANAKRRALGNKILASMIFPQGDHFTGAGVTTTLVKYGKLLLPAAKRNLENFVLRYLADWMTDDYRFHGANDNAPFGCNAAVALAGQYFDRPVLVEFARNRFRRLKRLLDLRGYIHEANSPTYAAISLMYTADLAELCRDEETRSIALRAEQRIWQETLLHFHPAIRHQIGPFSRGYQDDNASQCSNVMIVLYCAFGEISPFNPLRMLFPPTPGTFAHNTWAFQWACCAGSAGPTYHPPLELVKRCLERKTPFSSLGSNEFFPINETPCAQTSVQVHGEQEWALSSFGSRLWAGHTVPLQALYCRHKVDEKAKIVEQLAAIRSLYTRYYVSENFLTALPRNPENAYKEVYLDCASAFVAQHEGTALLGYVPVLGPEKVRTMKASVIFPLQHSRPDEIWHGQQRLAGFSSSFEEVDWAFVRDGDIYLAFYPLIAKQRDALLCTQQYDDYGDHGMISFFNMSGFSEFALNAKERRSYGSGMVMEISSKRAEGSFEKFRQKIAAAKIEQRQYGSQRDLLYSRKGVELELIYDFEQLSLRRAAANGALVSSATKLETHPRLPLIE